MPGGAAVAGGLPVGVEMFVADRVRHLPCRSPQHPTLVVMTSTVAMVTEALGGNEKVSVKNKIEIKNTF